MDGDRHNWIGTDSYLLGIRTGLSRTVVTVISGNIPTATAGRSEIKVEGYGSNPGGSTEQTCKLIVNVVEKNDPPSFVPGSLRDRYIEEKSPPMSVIEKGASKRTMVSGKRERWWGISLHMTRSPQR